MKKLLFGTASVLAITLVSILNVASTTTADLDELGIQQELRSHGEQLDNHEDRITNTEADVRVIQEKTATPPAETRVIIREVSTPRAEHKTETQTETKTVVEPAPEPEPVTVVSYKVTTEGDEKNHKKYCAITYSDGSVSNDLWIVKATVNMKEGEKITYQILTTCNDSIIGQPKS